MSPALTYSEVGSPVFVTIDSIWSILDERRPRLKAPPIAVLLDAIDRRSTSDWVYAGFGSVRPSGVDLSGCVWKLVVQSFEP